MNIGLVYRNRPLWPKWSWVARSLAAIGHRTIQVANIDELEAVDRSADIVLFDHREPGPGRKRIVPYARRKRAFWATWWFDLFIAQRHQDLIPLFGDLNRCMDAVFVKERGMLPDYKAQGINAFWFDQGCPEDYPECRHGTAEFDILVFGSLMEHYRQRREDVRRLVEAGFRVAWAGNNGVHPNGVVPLPWTTVENLPELMGRAKLTLHVDLRHDIEGYRSDRFWLATGSGACLLKRFTAGDPTVPHVSYRELDNATLDGIRELLSDDERRENIGRMARKAVMESHTYEHRARQLVEGCEGWPGLRELSRQA